MEKASLCMALDCALQLFNVIPGHRSWYKSTTRMRFPIFYRFPDISFYWSKVCPNYRNFHYL